MSEENINEENIVQLSSDEKNELKKYFSHIQAPSSLKSKVLGKKSSGSKKPVYRKPALLAASIAFLLGLGMLLPIPFTKLPSIAQLHTEDKFQYAADDLTELSKKLGIDLNDEQLAQFWRNDYFLVGASQKNILGKKITKLFFSNTEGERISVCFLPKNYDLDKCRCHKLEVINIPTNHRWVLSRGDEVVDVIDFPSKANWEVFKVNHNGTSFDCGNQKNCHFAYWQSGNSIVAVVSDKLSDMEMASLAMPLRKS